MEILEDNRQRALLERVLPNGINSVSRRHGELVTIAIETAIKRFGCPEVPVACILCAQGQILCNQVAEIIVQGVS